MNAVRFVSSLALVAVATGLPVQAAAPLVRDPDPLPKGALLRLGTARLRHPARITSLSLSQDGRTLAASDERGNVRLWNVETGRLELSLSRPATSVALSPDGATLITSERDNKGDQSVRLWDARNGEALHVVKDLTAQRVMFSPNGKRFAGTDEKGRIAFYDVKTARLQGTLGAIRPLIRPHVAYSRNNRYLAVVDRAFGQKRNFTVAVWDLDTGKEKCRVFDDRDDPITGIALTPDGDALAVATARRVQLWDTARVEPPILIEASDSVSFDGTGTVLVTGGTLTSWILGADAPIRVANYRATTSLSVVSTDARRIVGVGPDGDLIRVWDTVTGKERLFAPNAHRDEISAVAWSRDGKAIATGSGGDGSVRIWNAATGRPLRAIPLGGMKGRGQDLSMLAFSPDGRSITLPGLRREIEGRASVTLPTAHPLAHSRDGRHTAWLSDRDEVIVEEDGRRLYRLFPGRRYDPGCASLAFSPDGRTLAVGHFGDDDRNNKRLPVNVLQLFDVRSGRRTAAFRPDRFAPDSLALSPDGRTVASSAQAQQVELYDVVKRRVLTRLEGHEEGTRPRPIAFSPDGALVATSGKKGGIVLWEAASGKAIRQLPGHDGGTRALAFSPDGTRLLSGGADSTAIVWPVVPRGKREWDRAASAKLWADLAKEPPEAHSALWSLLAAPSSEAVGMLSQRLRPEPAVDRKRLDRLIVALGDEAFDTREEAEKDLQKESTRAETALRMALARAKDQETRKRLLRLVAVLDAGPSAADLRARRAIQALETLATPEAEALLEQVARGGSGYKTEAAEAALERLDAARRTPPVTAVTPRAERPEVKGRVPRKLGAHKGEVAAIVFDPEGKTALTAGHDGKVRRWDVDGGKELLVLDAHEGGVFGLAQSSDGKRFATAGADGHVRLWTADGGLLLKVPGHKGGAYSVAISPDGTTLTTGGKDGLMRQWATDGGKAGRVIFVTLGTVRSITYSTDGKRLLVGATGGWGVPGNGRIVPLHYPDEVRVWSTETGKQQPDTIDQLGHFARYSRDSRLVLTAKYDTALNPTPRDPSEWVVYTPEVNLVEADTGRVRLELPGRGLAAISPDGRFVLTATGSNFAAGGAAVPNRPLPRLTQLWETATGEEVLNILGEASAAALSPDGRRALIGEQGGTLYVADLAPRDVFAVKSREEFATLWEALGGDAAVAYRAAWALADWGDNAVPLIRARLGPAAADDPVLRRLVAGLNAERHIIRRACFVALSERGAEAGPALKAALDRTTSALLRRQIEQLSDLPTAGRLPNERRLDRADWVLERIGTKDAQAARQVLAGWRK